MKRSLSRARFAGLLLLCVSIVIWRSPNAVEKNPDVATAPPESIPIKGKDAITLAPHISNTIPEPTFEERLAIGKRFAFKVANYQFLRQADKIRKKNDETISLTRLGDSEWHIPDNLISTTEGCLVYSFGVADHDGYTEEMAQRGCQVFAMDPTVKHPTNWMPNVQFYPWGLANRAKDNQTSIKTWSHPIYGTITGSFYTLPEIVHKLGHTQQTITALKLDCEGCEFAAFRELWQQSSSTNVRIRQIDVEFHFASTLGMVDANDVARMYYAHVWLKTNQCQLIRQRRHEGFQHDQDKVPTVLIEAGVSSHHCCYEMTYLCSGN